MDFLIALWLPILVAAVAVFFCSFLAWAVSPHHKGDFTGMPNEDAFMDHVRGLGLAPGRYGFPYAATQGACRDPAFMEKFKRGPTGMLNVWPPMGGMGRNMALTFGVFLLVSLLIGYLAWTVLQPGADFARVMRVVGTAGILSYSFAFLPNMIWFNGGGRAALMCVIDGIIYGLVTGLVFAFFWPGVAAA